MAVQHNAKATIRCPFCVGCRGWLCALCPRVIPTSVARWVSEAKSSGGAFLQAVSSKARSFAGKLRLTNKTTCDGDRREAITRRSWVSEAKTCRWHIFASDVAQSTSFAGKLRLTNKTTCDDRAMKNPTDRQPKNPTLSSWIFSFVPLGTTSFAWHTQHHLSVSSTSLPSRAAQMNEVTTSCK